MLGTGHWVSRRLSGSGGGHKTDFPEVLAGCLLLHLLLLDSSYFEWGYRSPPRHVHTGMCICVHVIPVHMYAGGCGSQGLIHQLSFLITLVVWGKVCH